ncbi:hypothetical protein AQJ11_29025 [Streptomyces corchorusii]|uniref:Secreted protein n=2 Tax=Streptomyces TaxID=1883 RepID=A0A101PZ07_STRCK|nr:hypothetical protein [Streptomyces corchorusii]ALO98885.1 hypothetical protein SHL15_7906 [Streptomyces hygroscopicus subsp. limoneus]KUN20258.1 hypothetical protein AQJ11_29025 [Streptomyces corchorusii]
MKVRSTVVTAVVSAAAAVAATGITYASAASASVPQQAPAAVAAVTGGNGNGNSNSKGNEGNNGKDNEGRGDKGRGNNDRDEDNEGRGEDEGRIQINERSYSTRPGDCITVVSGLGAKTLNVRNESRKAVEVFRGAVCDNGAPIATVGPHSSSYGVEPGCTEGIDIEDGVVASFRVIKRHHDEY